MRYVSKRLACAMIGALLGAALVQGCSLLVTTDGLSGGAGTTGNGGVDANADALTSSMLDGAIAVGEGGQDAASATTLNVTSTVGDVLRVNGNTPEHPATEINAGSGSNAVSKQTGIRFADVRIPKGAVIMSATLHLVASEDQSGAMTNTTLAFEAADDAAAWTGAFADFDGRPRGTKVPWAMIEAWKIGEPHVSPDLAAALQEVVARPGWVSGNAVVLYWSNNAAITNSQRVAYTAGTSSAVDPVLVIQLR